jgi:hypothetical protein
VLSSAWQAILSKNWAYAEAFSSKMQQRPSVYLPIQRNSGTKLWENDTSDKQVAINSQLRNH